MGGDDCGLGCAGACEVPPRFRRALWIAIAVNAAMFVIEIGAGWRAVIMQAIAELQRAAHSDASKPLRTPANSEIEFI